MDRNSDCMRLCLKMCRSLSARRAWIEIARARKSQAANHVALRKESVDRNSCVPTAIFPRLQSLSARRAWIEMKMGNDV